MRGRASLPVRESTFAVLDNGAPGTAPASDLVEYLLAHDAQRVTTIFHPLAAEEGNSHKITTYEPSNEPRQRTVRLLSRPPYTYPLDLLTPLWTPRVDGWFAFNNLLCGRGLCERRAGRVGKVVYWPVDFVPDRF